ncbi:hypothetical protein ACIBO5_56115 [Nonomuraea angiospora]|uniref:hypothetical protein n=1 Tax=Nonomuraea angiospora TaxID=46172 RepID=UPI0037875B60
MWRRLSLFCAAVLTALAGLQGAGAAQSAALAPTREACRNLGNGNLCIRVAPTSSLAAKITVWYDKNAGAKRYIRLGTTVPDRSAGTTAPSGSPRAR